MMVVNCMFAVDDLMVWIKEIEWIVWLNELIVRLCDCVMMRELIMRDGNRVYIDFGSLLVTIDLHAKTIHRWSWPPLTFLTAKLIMVLRILRTESLCTLGIADSVLRQGGQIPLNISTLRCFAWLWGQRSDKRWVHCISNFWPHNQIASVETKQGEDKQPATTLTSSRGY